MQIVTNNGSTNGAEFHSFLVSQHLNSVEQAFREYNQSLDEISNDIRNIEKALKDKRINVPFYYVVSHASDAGVYFRSGLKWAEHEDQGFRLLHCSESGGISSESESKSLPLIECKVETRINQYQHLSNFLAAFAKDLQRAKDVREYEIEADMKAFFGML